MSTSTSIDELSPAIKSLANTLSASGRTKVLRSVAREIRLSQARRIKTNRDPDGASFIPRKRAGPRPFKYKIRYMSKSGSVSEREVNAIISKKKENFTGYDSKSGKIKTFKRENVLEWISKTAGTNPRKKGTGLMFRQLHKANFLKYGATGNTAEIGFAGKVARIANIHQYGEQPYRTATYRMPVRELLGFTHNDIDLIKTAFEKEILNAIK